MEKPNVVSTQHYNWDYAGKSYMFVILQHDRNFEVSLETRTYSGEWVSVFRRSFVPSGLPSFVVLTEIAMRYFAEMFGIEYPETASLPKANFLDDPDKMKDLLILSKEDFLKSYSYLTEEEYDETLRIYHNIVDAQVYSLKHGGDDEVLEDEVYEELGRLE